MYNRNGLIITEQVNEEGEIVFSQPSKEYVKRLSGEFFYLLTEDSVELITNKFNKNPFSALQEFVKDNIEARYVKINSKLKLMEKTKRFLCISPGDYVVLAFGDDGFIIEKIYK